MSKSVKKNYLYNLIFQILTLITPFITTPYLSRILNADGVGVVSYAESIVSYFILFAGLGITVYGPRAVSCARDSLDERSKIFWDTQILKFIIGGIVSIFYLLVVLFLMQGDYFWINLFLIGEIVAVSLDVSWYFQGMEEFKKIALRNIFFKIISVAFVFIFVKKKEDIILFVIGNVTLGFIGNFSLWMSLPKIVKRLPFKTIKPFRNIKEIMALFIPTIAIQIYTVLDKTMIGLITQDPFQNGYYEQAIKTAKMALTVISCLGVVMIPSISYFYEKGKIDSVKNLIYKSFSFSFMLSIPLCFGLFMVSENFVPWFFGDGYDEVVDLLKILSFLIIIIGLNTITGNQYLIPTKREKIYTITVIIGAVVNFTLNIFLIYFFKSTGAAVASVIAETTIVVIQFVILRKELSLLKILKISVKYFFAGLVMVVALYFENIYLSPSIINTLIMVISGAFVYFLILFIERDAFFITNVKNVLGKIKKKPN